MTNGLENDLYNGVIVPRMHFMLSGSNRVCCSKVGSLSSHVHYTRDLKHTRVVSIINYAQYGHLLIQL